MNKKTDISKKTTGLAGAICALVMAMPDLSQAQQIEDVPTDIMIGYTTRAKDRRGGNPQMRAAIREGLNRMNAANRDSLTEAYVQVNRMLEFNYDDSSGGLRDHFNDWRNRRGGSSAGISQNDWENNEQTDFSCLVTVGGGVRGVASSNYCCVTEGQIATHTLGHEVGHLYGCSHAQGHTMATANGARYTFLASGGRPNSSIVNHYSNPLVRFNGKYTAGIDPSRYNALRIFQERNNRSTRRAGFVDGSIISLKSVGDRWVSSESGRRTMNANRTRIGSYETFRVQRVGSQWALKATVNNRYVSSENGNNNGINANRTRIGNWERFNVTKEGRKVRIQGNNRAYVSAEGGTRSMTCNRDTIGREELWDIFRR